jgi:hypothetical protein
MKAGERSHVLLSLPDIARLAAVQRPVVSMWRSRSAGTDDPFPDPVTTVRSSPRFDARQVVAWLLATGRGNNPEVAEDAAVFGRPAELREDDAEALGVGLSAVLCLRSLASEALSGRAAAELMALARRVDPHDELIVRELREVTDRLPALAAWADSASDAAYGVESAFDRLTRRRDRAGSVPTTLDAPLHRLVAEAAAALAADAGPDRPIYIDDTPGGSELLLSVLGAHGDGGLAELDTGASVVLADVTGTREARRRLIVHGIHPTVGVPDHRGRREPLVRLLQLTGGGDVGDVLTAVDEVQLQMDDGQRAVVIAPASVLCDRLPDRELDAQRDHLVRLGRVRAVVRLPERLVTAHPRQRLGLWVLGPAHSDVPLDLRWTAVADLSDATLSDEAVSDLVSDLVAAMGDLASVRAHAFRFARLRQTSTLLIGRRALVGPGVSATVVNRTPAAQRVVAVQQARQLLMAHGQADPLRGVDVAVGHGELADTAAAIGALIQRGLLRVVPGSRIDVHSLPPGTVPVITVQDLHQAGPAANHRVEVLALESAYPSARRTRPGDVVFCTSPRPRAVVDAEGGSVVAYPARVLRVVNPSESGLVPEVLVTDINLLPDSARAWRAWRVRAVPPEQVAVVSAALACLRHEETRARQRAERIESLTRMLADGVAARAFTLAAGDADQGLTDLMTSDVNEPQRRS